MDKAYPCDAVAWKGGSGWDAKGPKGMVMMEFKIAAPPPTTFPAMYPVTNTNPLLVPPPTAGHAFAIWNQLTGTPAVPETSATSGTVTLTAMNANTDVKGTFNLMFGTSVLSGTFDALYCAGAGEP